MVTQKTLEKYMTKAAEIANEAGTAPEVAERVMKAIGHQIEKNRRQPKPPAPEGGILFSDASRKYNIPKSTLSDWLNRGWVNLVAHIGKFKFLQESDIKRLSACDRHAGRRTIEVARDCTDK